MPRSWQRAALSATLSIAVLRQHGGTPRPGWCTGVGSLGRIPLGSRMADRVDTARYCFQGSRQRIRFLDCTLDAEKFGGPGRRVAAVQKDPRYSSWLDGRGDQRHELANVAGSKGSRRSITASFCGHTAFCPVTSREFPDLQQPWREIGLILAPGPLVSCRLWPDLGASGLRTSERILSLGL